MLWWFLQPHCCVPEHRDTACWLWVVSSSCLLSKGIMLMYRLPRWHGGKESPCQCKRHWRHAFSLWVGKIPWRRAQQPTPVFLLGKFHGKRNFPGGSAVKDPPAKQEMQVPSLGQEDALEEGMAIRSSILVWEIPWTEKPGGLQSIGSQKSWTQLSG